jgi:hypothetical protein
MPRFHLFAAALLLASTASHADNNNCEAIRGQIDAKVRASGVTDFALAVVDANAQAEGKVVGSCDLGSKKIVYQKTSSPADSPSKPRPARERILTECKDGSVSMGGDCKS